MLLGWDSPYYVYLAGLIEDHGLASMVSQWNYPNLYVILLWAVGKLVGDLTLAERLLPVAWLAVLLFAYQRVSLDLSRDTFVSNLTVILAGIAIGTVRTYADLHRGLMALALSFVVLILFSRQATSLFTRSRSTVVILVLLLAVASTQLETYAILAMSLVVSTAFRRDIRRAIETSLFCAVPLVILSPLLVGFFSEYPARIGVLVPDELLVDPKTALLFAAGSVVTLPFVLLGGLHLMRLVQARNRMAELMLSWVLTLAAIFILLSVGLVKLPAVRVLYLMPVGLLLAFSVPWIERVIRSRRLAITAVGTVRP